MEKELYTLNKKYYEKNDTWDITIKFGDYTHVAAGLTKKEVETRYEFFEGVLECLGYMIKNDYVKKPKNRFDTKAIAEECRNE